MMRKRIFLFSSCVFLTLIWLIQIVQGSMPFLDRWTQGFVDSLKNTFIYDLARFITFFGSGPVLIPFVLLGIIILWIFHRNLWISVLFGIGSLASYLLNSLLKIIILRPRPMIQPEFHAKGYSFPSGHAMISFVCYALFAYSLFHGRAHQRLKKIVQRILFLFPVMIGLSRYVLKVHYLTDVLVGFFCGYLIVVFFVKVTKKIEQLSDLKGKNEGETFILKDSFD